MAFGIREALLTVGRSVCGGALRESHSITPLPTGRGTRMGEAVVRVCSFPSPVLVELAMSTGTHWLLVVSPRHGQHPCSAVTVLALDNCVTPPPWWWWPWWCLCRLCDIHQSSCPLNRHRLQQSRRIPGRPALEKIPPLSKNPGIAPQILGCRRQNCPWMDSAPREHCFLD